MDIYGRIFAQLSGDMFTSIFIPRISQPATGEISHGKHHFRVVKTMP